MLPIAMRGKLICRSIWLAAVVLASAHGSLQAMAPASSANINFDADIVRSTCRVDGLAGFLSLGNIKPTALPVVGHKYFNLPEGTVKIKCDGLKRAKISFSVNSEECPSRVAGWRFSCGGPNKTVGIAPDVKFLNAAGQKQGVILKNDLGSNAYDVKVDKGIVDVDVRSVILGRTDDTVTEYGPITASFGIKLISD